MAEVAAVGQAVECFQPASGYAPERHIAFGTIGSVEAGCVTVYRGNLRWAVSPEWVRAA